MKFFIIILIHWYFTPVHVFSTIKHSHGHTFYFSNRPPRRVCILNLRRFPDVRHGAVDSGRLRPRKEHHRRHTNASLVQRRQKRIVHIGFGGQRFTDEKRRRLRFPARSILANKTSAVHVNIACDFSVCTYTVVGTTRVPRRAGRLQRLHVAGATIPERPSGRQTRASAFRRDRPTCRLVRSRRDSSCWTDPPVRARAYGAARELFPPRPHTSHNVFGRELAPRRRTHTHPPESEGSKRQSFEKLVYHIETVVGLTRVFSLLSKNTVYATDFIITAVKHIYMYLRIYKCMNMWI